MRDSGLPTPAPYGFVELTPEREYLLVTEFFDGASSSARRRSTTTIIDDGLGIVRKLWEAGLAHRDKRRPSAAAATRYPPCTRLSPRREMT